MPHIVANNDLEEVRMYQHSMKELKKATKNLRIRQSRCSEFQPFVILHFNTTVSTFRDFPTNRDESAPSTVPLLRISLAAQWSSVFVKWGWMISGLMDWDVLAVV